MSDIENNTEVVADATTSFGEKTYAELRAERLEAAKTKYDGELRMWKAQGLSVSVFLFDDGKVVFFRSPSRAELSVIQQSYGNDLKLYNDSLINTCWLAGDEETRTEDKYLLELQDYLGLIIEKVNAMWVKL